MALDRGVRIITDSGCDLPEGWEKTYGIDIMNFEVMLNDVMYRERVDVSSKEFYALMNSSQSIPTTNQITVPRFEEKFIQCRDDGVKEILAVLINSKGSQTYMNALMAKKKLEEKGELDGVKVHIIDSRTYSLGYGFPLVEAAKKLDAGQSVELVLDYLDDWFSCAEIYLLPLNLRHMKKSGRITAAAAFLGELMGLKPIISLIDGVSEVLKKARGEAALLDEAVKIIKSRVTPETPWAHLYADELEFSGEFEKRVTKELGSPPAIESEIGCVVGCNTGPKVAAIIIKGEHRGPMKYD